MKLQQQRHTFSNVATGGGGIQFKEGLKGEVQVYPISTDSVSTFSVICGLLRPEKGLEN
jgi:hypothetical protein